MYSAAFQITYRAVWIELFSSKFFIKRRISENCSCAFDWIFWPIRFLLGFSIFLFFFFFLISATLSSLWPFLNLSPSIHLSLFSLFFHFHIFFRYFIQRSTRPLICVDWSVFARSLSRNLKLFVRPKEKYGLDFLTEVFAFKAPTHASKILSRWKQTPAELNGIFIYRKMNSACLQTHVYREQGKKSAFEWKKYSSAYTHTDTLSESYSKEIAIMKDEVSGIMRLRKNE